jgi:hypothetical protein
VARFIFILSGVRLSPFGTAASTGLFYQPQTIDDSESGIIGGMKIGSAYISARTAQKTPFPVAV